LWEKIMSNIPTDWEIFPASLLYRYLSVEDKKGDMHELRSGIAEGSNSVRYGIEWKAVGDEVAFRQISQKGLGFVNLQDPNLSGSIFTNVEYLYSDVECEIPIISSLTADQIATLKSSERWGEYCAGMRELSIAALNDTQEMSDLIKIPDGIAARATVMKHFAQFLGDRPAQP
jgi:hypothetical protein